MKKGLLLAMVVSIILGGFIMKWIGNGLGFVVAVIVALTIIVPVGYWYIRKRSPN